MSLKTTLLPPKLPSNLPQTAQWLAGEGAGSWFVIEPKAIDFEIKRYSPEGNLECEGLFKIFNQTAFNIETDYHFTHLSHCKTVRIIQQNITFVFERV
ncbi:hypothetical protein FRY74_10370 [Vicingus serpentipes]|uniref:DUF6695 domain-containing protein n=1 Tax=Vicingus serpentipes TaxID=1926625 RepID=A0A5C6RR12_9FLAO|nr:DUF6695 family protein [Vicingus serpentipes]TXB64846.1 hypothetical protein FRY74_10370 [Vicingus serpentipes]